VPDVSACSTVWGVMPSCAHEASFAQDQQVATGLLRMMHGNTVAT